MPSPFDKKKEPAPGRPGPGIGQTARPGPDDVPASAPGKSQAASASPLRPPGAKPSPVPGAGPSAAPGSGTSSAPGANPSARSSSAAPGTDRSGDKASEKDARRASEAASDIADVAKAAVTATAKAAVAEVKELASHVGDELGATAEEQKEHGADAIKSFADAARTAARELDRTTPAVARSIESAAAEVETFSDALREKSLSEIASSAADFARRQPMAFVAGAVAAGFAVSRFLKSSAPAPRPAEPKPNAQTRPTPGMRPGPAPTAASSVRGMPGDARPRVTPTVPTT